MVRGPQDDRRGPPPGGVVGAASRLSEQRYESLYRQPGLLDDSSKRAAFEVFAMKSDDHKTGTGGMPEKAMGAATVIEDKACTPQCPDYIRRLARG